jgi:hypothetical protein
MINTQREKNSLKSTVKEGKISLNEKWNKTKMRYLNNWLWKVRQPLLILSPIVFKLKIVFKVKIVFSWQILLCWGSPHSFSHGRSLLATLHCSNKNKKNRFRGNFVLWISVGYKRRSFIGLSRRKGIFSWC